MELISCLLAGIALGVCLSICVLWAVFREIEKREKKELADTFRYMQNSRQVLVPPCCGNCKHADLGFDKAPCCDCENLSEWEAQV